MSANKTKAPSYEDSNFNILALSKDTNNQNQNQSSSSSKSSTPNTSSSSSTPKSSSTSSSNSSSNPKKYSSIPMKFNSITNPYNNYTPLPTDALSNTILSSSDSICGGGGGGGDGGGVLCNILTEKEVVSSDLDVEAFGHVDKNVSVDSNLLIAASNTETAVNNSVICETVTVDDSNPSLLTELCAVFPGEFDLCNGDKKILASYFKDEFEKGLIVGKMRQSVSQLALTSISREVFCNNTSRRHIIDNYIKIFAWSDLNRTIDKKGVTWESLMNSITEPKKKLARSLFKKSPLNISFNDEISSISFLMKLSQTMDGDSTDSTSCKSGLIATWKHSLTNNASVLFKALIQDMYGASSTVKQSNSGETDDDEENGTDGANSDSSFESNGESSASSSDESDGDDDGKSSNKSESNESDSSESDGDDEGESNREKGKKKKDKKSDKKKVRDDKKSKKSREKLHDGEWSSSHIKALSKAPTRNLRKIYIKKEGKKLDALSVHLLSIESITNILEQSALYFLTEVLVKIVLTTATPLQLAKIFCTCPVDNPRHITCIVGNFSLYSQLLNSMLYSHKFKDLSTITFLLPDICNNDIATFTRYITNALNDTVIVSRVRNIAYGKKEGRKIITFTRIGLPATAEVSEDAGLAMTSRIDKAMDQVEKMSFDLPGGVHPLPRDEIHLLIEHLNVKEGDSFWEIGVGVPFLAFALSAAANGGVVLATDLQREYDLLKIILDIYYNQSLENGDDLVRQINSKSISIFCKSPPSMTAKRKKNTIEAAKNDTNKKKQKKIHSPHEKVGSSCTPKSALVSKNNKGTKSTTPKNQNLRFSQTQEESPPKILNFDSVV